MGSILVIIQFQLYLYRWSIIFDILVSLSESNGFIPDNKGSFLRNSHYLLTKKIDRIQNLINEPARFSTILDGQSKKTESEY